MADAAGALRAARDRVLSLVEQAHGQGFRVADDGFAVPPPLPPLDTVSSVTDLAETVAIREQLAANLADEGAARTQAIASPLMTTRDPSARSLANKARPRTVLNFGKCSTEPTRPLQRSKRGPTVRSGPRLPTWLSLTRTRPPRNRAPDCSTGQATPRPAGTNAGHRVVALA